MRRAADDVDDDAGAAAARVAATAAAAADEFAALAASRTAALNARWFDAETASTALTPRHQRARAVRAGPRRARPVDGGAAEAAARRALIALARRGGHFDTGMFGIHPALAALSESGADGHATALSLSARVASPDFATCLTTRARRRFGRLVLVSARASEATMRA